LGILEQGWNLRWKFEKDPINKTDAYGNTLIDSVFLGVNCWVSGLAKEWKNSILAATSPYNTWAASGATNFDLGIIGRMDTNIATTLVLSSTAGTPSASAPASATFSQVIQDDSAQVETLLGPTHRKTPFMFRVIPFNPSGTTIRFFSCT